MMHKYYFEALDTTLRDVMSIYNNLDEIFGGKVVLFGGDFRQIFSVVPRGSRSDISRTTINASYICNYVQVLTLTKNMRLTCGPVEQGKKEIAEFSNWLFKIGEGRVSKPNDGYEEMDIPREILITKFDDPIVSIKFISNYQSYDYLKSRAI